MSDEAIAEVHGDRLVIRHGRSVVKHDESVGGWSDREIIRFVSEVCGLGDGLDCVVTVIRY